MRPDDTAPLTLTAEELCVAAAFLGVPCLYGVPDRWRRRARAGLTGQVLAAVARLERSGLLLTEPGGTVWVLPALHRALTCMGNAEYIARVHGVWAEGRGRLYLYRCGNEVLLLVPGRRGFSLVPLAGPLRLHAAPKAGEEQWSGVLVFAKTGGMYTTVLDEFRAAGDDDTDVWQQLTKIFWPGQTGQKEEAR